jgi:hypothetical protein
MGKRRTQHPARCAFVSCYRADWENDDETFGKKLPASTLPINHVLVGGFNHLEKYESQWANGKDDIPYMKWKIKND